MPSTINHTTDVRRRRSTSWSILRRVGVRDAIESRAGAALAEPHANLQAAIEVGSGSGAAGSSGADH
jgi:hypothetical protein